MIYDYRALAAVAHRLHGLCTGALVADDECGSDLEVAANCVEKAGLASTASALRQYVYWSAHDRLDPKDPQVAQVLATAAMALFNRAVALSPIGVNP